MKVFINVLAVILIVAGIGGLTYSGFSYDSQEKVAEIGNLKIVAETEKTVPFSPYIAGLCIALGVGLIVFNRIKR